MQEDFKHIADILFEKMQPRLTSMIEEAIQRHIDSLWIAMDHAVFNNVPGDYLEFGVREGQSVVRAYRAYHHYRNQMIAIANRLGAKDEVVSPMRFFAFDAFEEGLPEAKGPDATALRSPHWRPGTMACPLDVFWNNMRKAGIRESEIVAFKGYFEKTLSRDNFDGCNLTRAAVIHLDCDYYESTATALKACEKLIGLGTIVVFDDYFRYQGSENHGQYLAFKEFCVSNPMFSFREMSRAHGNSTVFICSAVSSE